MRTGYKVEIREHSKELSAKEKIMMKDFSDAEQFDEIIGDTPLIITPESWAEISVHNENSKNDKDYIKYVIIATDGRKYITGSNSFWDAFMNMWADMSGETEEWSVKVYKKKSNNYAGKFFLTCSIV